MAVRGSAARGPRNKFNSKRGPQPKKFGNRWTLSQLNKLLLRQFNMLLDKFHCDNCEKSPKHIRTHTLTSHIQTTWLWQEEWWGNQLLVQWTSTHIQHMVTLSMTQGLLSGSNINGILFLSSFMVCFTYSGVKKYNSRQEFQTYIETYIIKCDVISTYHYKLWVLLRKQTYIASEIEKKSTLILSKRTYTKSDWERTNEG